MVHSQPEITYKNLEETHIMAFFMVAYDLSKYQMNNSAELNALVAQLKDDLELVIGGDKVTESSFIIDCEYKDEDQEMIAEDVFNIIFEELNNLKLRDGNTPKYADADLDQIRITVVKVDPNDDVISMNPIYQEL